MRIHVTESLRKATGARLAVVALMVAGAGGAGAQDWFRGEDYEEEAGPSFAMHMNTSDNVYGIAFGHATWLRGAPVLGDYFLGLFPNRIEDSWYGSVGMTIRLMPRWTVAPFAGGGGSYNQSLSKSATERDVWSREEEKLVDRGHSYWAGHVEAGVRIWLPPPVTLFELCARQTWSSLPGERDYWLLIVGTGTGF
jgi:hypothetical protein